MTQCTSTPLALRFVPTSISIYGVIGATVGFHVEAVKKEDNSPFDLTGWTITVPFVRRPPAPNTPPPPPLPIDEWTVTWASTEPSRFNCTLEASQTDIALPQYSSSVTLEWAVWIEAPDASQRIELLRGSLTLTGE